MKKPSITIWVITYRRKSKTKSKENYIHKKKEKNCIHKNAAKKIYARIVLITL